MSAVDDAIREAARDVVDISRTRMFDAEECEERVLPVLRSLVETVQRSQLQTVVNLIDAQSLKSISHTPAFRYGWDSALGDLRREVSALLPAPPQTREET